MSAPGIGNDTGSATAQIDRRSFITRTVLGVGGALVVGIELEPGVSWASDEVRAATAGGSVGVYVTIGADETVTLVCPGSEMGQGIMTSLPMILAEELMIDWSVVRVTLAGANPAYNRPTGRTTLGNSQSSGGSNSCRGYHDYLRETGATVRQKLIWAASSTSGIPVAELTALDGSVVRRSNNGVVASYGQLASLAATMTPNDVAWVERPYRIIGQRIPRIDIPLKVNGSAVYGIDIQLPGMVYASVKQSPKVGQTIGTVGAAAPGTTVVRLAGNTAVGVVHPRSTWDAMEAAKKQRITWVDAPYTSSIDSRTMATRRSTLMASGTAIVDERAGNLVGDAPAVIAATPTNRVFSATYSAPFVNHVTMEPQNATAWVSADGRTMEIWAPTQSQTNAVTEAAAVTGIPAANITLHTTFLGGGGGRRLKNDYVKQVAEIAMAVKGKPVKMVWTREEDFGHDFLRPASLTRFQGAVDATGALTALSARVVCGRTSAGSGLSSSAVDGISTALYTFPAKRVEWVEDTVQVPQAAWRAVGHSQNCFFLESFIDEIARGTGQDPIAFRKRLLGLGGTPSENQQRAIDVLDRLIVESGWNTPVPTGRARGVALSMSYGDTVCAQVAEVSGTMPNLKVWKVTVVIDPGQVINPDTIEAQVESSVLQGLGTAMWNEQVFTSGGPTRLNFNTYRMGLMRDTPEITTVIIESGAKIGGVGEPGLPPTAPAVANAFAALGGTRLRSMPFVSGTVVSPPSAAPTISGFTPTSGRVGVVVTINGANFSGASRVVIGGVAATFTVQSAGQISATVPRRARTGKISVTTAAGTATSSGTFTVVA